MTFFREELAIFWGAGLTFFREGLTFFREGLTFFREGLRFFWERLRFFREGLIGQVTSKELKNFPMELGFFEKLRIFKWGV